MEPRQRRRAEMESALPSTVSDTERKASASSTPIRALLLVVAGVLVTASVAVFLFLQAPGSLDNPPVAAPRPSPRVPPPVREVPKGPDPSALLYEPEGHDHFAADALDASGLLPLTTEFQLELYRHQHPVNCSEARFLVVTPGPNGLGSDLHVAGHHLMTAYTHGYVFLWGNRSGEQFVKGDPEHLCPGGRLNYECFFRAPSSCSLADAIDWAVLASASPSPSPSSSPLPDDAPRHIRMMRERDAMMRRQPRMQDREAPLRNGSSHVFGTLSEVLRIYNDNPERTLPASLLARLRGMGMGEFEVRSWVRAQTVGYLARLNDATLASIKASRLDPRAHGGGRDVNAPPPAALPFPLPRGSIAAHVRHGDKHREMSLVDEIDYLKAARRLVMGSQGDAATQAALAEKSRSFGFSAPVGVTSRRDPPPPPALLGERIFISTEDPEALARLVGAGPSYGWEEVLFSRFPRLNEGPASQMESAGPGAVRLTRSHLGQLLLALEADAWVGTYASNWNRLIDELRGVWVPKAAGPYVEVGDLHDYQVW